ncbi:hypothetical protein ACTORR_17785 [Pseudomonas sp. SAR267]|uniref:hypothetical protein n=1 Tax=Pseudomonas TaxID=286 RepID=UPI0006D3D86A|nr:MULTISPECIES: hypothetical protein [unclassified Pseudomonas]AXQ46724.1 hypothetical protein DZC31_03745 [Stenotrophomonas rhizophila]MBS3188443.1 hypothetical protein [Pseudomonas sp. PCH44]PIK77337.1 hypothetical protein CQW31_17520 [Pseudomonas sp. 382]
MTGTSDDLSQGEADNVGLVSDYLKRESWRFRWEKRLTNVTVALVITFYIALLGFVFLGNIRLTVGTWYFFTSVKPHSTGDIPIIVALSTVPTLLLIALLRYFHHRPKPEQDDAQAPLPISVEAAKEIIKATTDAMKAP